MKKIFTRRAKPIQIIGYPDKQRPDKWRSTVHYYRNETKSNKTGNVHVTFRRVRATIVAVEKQ